MVRTTVRELRRQELIAATITSLGINGFSNTTVREVSLAANASVGAIHYYFGGKDELILESVRWLLENFRTSFAEKYSIATTPLEKIISIIDTNFDPSVFKRQHIFLWAQISAESRRDLKMAKYYRLNTKRVYSNYVHYFRLLVSDEQARSYAMTIQALIDGIWMQAGQSQGELEPEYWRKMVINVLYSLLNESDLIANA